MDKQFNANDYLSFDDKEHGLRGHVSIYRENKKTKEKTLWYEGDNTITISGYQWILMKMFDLYMDSKHSVPYEDLSKDTTLIIPDLNNSGSYQIGIDPELYSTMDSNISENNFIQGFMVGNGGSGEDAITTKNTDYSFIRLRNPIPFQQTQTSLDPSIADKYLGVLRMGSSSFSKSYYIKKFDETPHIYHSWWRDGQKWDYVDPVTPNDLGPNATNGVGKTNRIETYVQCKLSIDENDCLSYFSHDGSSQTALLNELGLVAYDAIYGSRSIINKSYDTMIKTILTIIFDNNRTTDDIQHVISLSSELYTVFQNLKINSNPNAPTFIEVAASQTNINNFINNILEISTATVDNIDIDGLKNSLSNTENNIGVVAHYNQNGILIYVNDEFKTHLSNQVFNNLSTDEAQRIKLITYYTFNSIPLESNSRTIIDYRIYAN